MAKERCPGSGTPVEKAKFSQYGGVCPECKKHVKMEWQPPRLAEHQRATLRLSPNQVTALKAQLAPLLAPYFRDQGWASVAVANYATQEMVIMLRDLGVLL